MNPAKQNPLKQVEGIILKDSGTAHRATHLMKDTGSEGH
jgi:hypothetical protein